MFLFIYLMLVIIASYLFYDKSKHFVKLSIYVVTNVYFVTYTYIQIIQQKSIEY